MRVDACVNSANTLSSWAAVETAQGEAGKASQLLVAAVEGCRRALEQEEDAAVSLFSYHKILLLPVYLFAAPMRERSPCVSHLHASGDMGCNVTYSAHKIPFRGKLLATFDMTGFGCQDSEVISSSTLSWG